jgi:GNAT superfamily N-acetyltransferase
MLPPPSSELLWLPPAVAGAAFLRDGTEVWVRPALPSDYDLIFDLLERESPTALEQRYFRAIRPEAEEGGTPAVSKPGDRLCLLVLGDRTARLAVLGLGEYLRLGTDAQAAEVSFLVAAPFRGRGIASLLLARLARAARAFGVVRFEARVLSDNSEMLEVFRGSGLPFTERTAPGEVDVVIPLSPEVDHAATAHRGEPASPEGASGTGHERRPQPVRHLA